MKQMSGSIQTILNVGFQSQWLRGMVCLIAIILSDVPHLGAQTDTAYHREVYADTNANLKSFQKVQATYKDDPLVFELEGWSDNGELRKIKSVLIGEDGGGWEEYYINDGQPMFVYSTYKAANDAGKIVSIENRFYFKNGSLFKWLNSEQKSPITQGEDFNHEEERLTSNFANFSKELNKKTKSKGKSKDTDAKVQTQTTAGKFVRVDEGDYFHWVMTDGSGEEVSFFILNPDASVESVLNEPESYVGRKCRITWKKSMEDIPEAGGKLEVEQVLSVEWLKK